MKKKLVNRKVVSSIGVGILAAMTTCTSVYAATDVIPQEGENKQEDSSEAEVPIREQTEEEKQLTDAKDSLNDVAAHLFWLQINLIDCHRINRYNDISIEKEKVPEHLFFCRDKCSGTIYKHGYYIKIRNRIQ